MINELPNSLEAEHAVIGGLIASNGKTEGFHNAIEKLTEDSFFSNQNARLFEIIKTLADTGKPIELQAVFLQLDRQDHDNLAEIVRNNPGFANLAYYANAVYEKFYERQLMQNLTMAVNSLSEAGTHQEKIDRVMSLVSTVDEPVEDSSVYTDEILEDYLRVIDERFNSGGDFIGMKTGLDSLDDRVQGLRGGDLVIVAGRPGMGKTVLSMNIAEYCANNQGHVKVFSMEMPKQQLVERMAASLGRIELKRLRNGKLEQDDWPKLNKAFGQMNAHRVNIDDRGGLNINQVKASARKTHRKQKLDLIVLDYIQLMAGTKGHASRVSEITEITRELKALAKELDIPIIAISQLSRKVEERVNKRPVISDLRESGSIEQDADLILLMYRDEYYNENSDYRGIVEIDVAKHRGGEPGKTYAASNLQYTRLDNLAPDYQHPEPQRQQPKGTFASSNRKY